MPHRVLLALVAGLSLAGGFALASATGIRPLGGLVVIAGGGTCAIRLWREAGPLRTTLAGAVYALCFAVSHPLGMVVGTWPAVVGVSIVAGAVVAAVTPRGPADAVSA